MPNSSGTKTNVSGPPLSRQMQALLIIAGQSAVADILLPLLDIAHDDVCWDVLDYKVLSGGQKAALSWAWVIWHDRVNPKWRDPFDGFGIMGASLQEAVLDALKCRHGSE